MRSNHSRDVSAPAPVVYDLLADVSGWPVIFPPTIHAESTDLGGNQQRIRLWATANETVKSWTSLRRLDPAGLGIEFSQEIPQQPMAMMRGRWYVEPVTADSCRVELSHEFEAVDNDPSALLWIERAVDSNSDQELDALETAATQAAGDEKLTFEFADSIEVSGSAREAYEFIDRADAWQKRLPHVCGVQLALVAPDTQLLKMDTVAQDGSTHTTASFRVCFPDHAIFYKQTTFPPFLAGHVGLWSFEEAAGTSIVTSAHTVVLAPAELGRLPESARSVSAARDFVTRALSANSQATLRQLKEAVEGETSDEV